MMVHYWTETCRPVSSKVYKDITLLCLMVYFTLILKTLVVCNFQTLFEILNYSV